MKHLLHYIRIVPLLLLGFQAKGQIQFEKISHDFGVLEEQEDFFVDVKLRNIGSKKAYFLSVRKPEELKFFISNETILPDSVSYLRFQPSVKKTGKFSYKAEIYTSDKNEPTIITISGNVKSLPENQRLALQSCPDFSKRRPQAQSDFKLLVEVIDSASREPLKDASVFIIRNGKQVAFAKSNAQGKAYIQLPPGYTYFTAHKDGYFTSDTSAYISFLHNKVQLELSMNPQICMPAPRFGPSTYPPIQEREEEKVITYERQNEEALESHLRNENRFPIEAPPSRELMQIPFDNFDTAHFALLNVVFVLDISNSMKAMDRTELLKSSLYALVDYLRPEDIMGVVTYNDKAKVLIAPRKGSHKEALKTPIETLKIAGATAGGEGIQLGYQQVQKHLNENRKSLVIVLTDGAFNKNSADYQFLVKGKEQVQLSVIGIQVDDKSKENLQEVARLGNGKYYSITNFSEARFNLIHAIRQAAFLQQ